MANNKITGFAKTVNELLKGQQYKIDYYQREYNWQTKQIRELVEDLSDRFMDAWEPGHSRKRVAEYPFYFMGAVIISESGSDRFIVDGQQRLTTLTLLLIHLKHLAAEVDADQAAVLSSLIMSKRYGDTAFNIADEDRNAVMQALNDGVEPDLTAASQSAANLAARFQDLVAALPEELTTQALAHFIDWLLERVQLVEINAPTDDDAYSIFETMNDRGLKLKPAEMLKGYLLANIDRGKRRDHANTLWRDRIKKLADLDEDGDADFLKTWLRSQYADSIRERSKGAKPRDWDRIGTEFHRWMREKASDIGLVHSDDFERLITVDVEHYGRSYATITREIAQVHPSSAYRFAGYNADRGFTLQQQLLLAPLAPQDGVDVVEKKVELVGRYVDIMLSRRVWNLRSLAYSTLSYQMFQVMRRLRRLSVPDLAQALYDTLSTETETFDTSGVLWLHQQNSWQVHLLLARLTDYVGVKAGDQSRYAEFARRTGVPYEIEHVWANHADRHTAEFPQASDFSRHRNLVGGLLLVPKSFNASYRDMPYQEKRPHYLSQNLLARSLHPQCYVNNPGFVQFIAASGLAFEPYEDFTKQSVLDRSELYRELAKRVWNPADILDAADVS